ncbi:MAG TPA: hypothetical protein VLN90_08380, partial [Thioalkalivibrio sp.]|nr:hypothetical protein [Thioalkalivibrio sp.]
HVLRSAQENPMSMTKRELFELKRREASNYARKMRMWQLQKPTLQKQVIMEEAGQNDLDLGEHPK